MHRYDWNLGLLANDICPGMDAIRPMIGVDVALRENADTVPLTQPFDSLADRMVIVGNGLANMEINEPVQPVVQQPGLGDIRYWPPECQDKHDCVQ